MPLFLVIAEKVARAAVRCDPCDASEEPEADQARQTKIKMRMAAANDRVGQAGIEMGARINTVPAVAARRRG